MDVAFAVPGSQYEDWVDCLEHEKDKVIAALESRLALLKSDNGEFLEAVSSFDTYEEG